MTGRTASIEAPCACGSTAVRQVNQFVLNDELWWDSEFSCEACGRYMCEHAGPGAAPDGVREALLAAHGPVRLRPAGPLPSAVAAMKVFREVSAASLSRARELVEELRRDGLVGTAAEMELLASRLTRRGVPVEVGR
ncbi:hypothetical protein OG689_37565 [Kitasatospora sp. NBC_00240]|uniref:hypothetical protein n=1 Tax=Kitasatospora sp. NBC_00240 TaxID=2903567 RepID=UPI0022524BA6|nr:hypothetical protein [Kitasatospora sp. NBC_00240]MCX5214905.1 hypothetical protein [Kitasatospora sp. NBC_00240]